MSFPSSKLAKHCKYYNYRSSYSSNFLVSLSNPLWICEFCGPSLFVGLTREQRISGVVEGYVHHSICTWTKQTKSPGCTQCGMCESVSSTALANKELWY